MRLKISSKQKLIAGYFIGLIIFSLFYFTYKNKTNSNLISRIFSVFTLLKQEESIYGSPVNLKIPSINLDSAVESVSIISNGEMDVPKKIENVAWFNLGPLPGEVGSAVIAGHYGWKNNKASAFDNLHKLSKGDTLYVEDNNGKVSSFVVRDTKRYYPDSDTKEIFLSNDGKSHLNLITCEGVWNKAEKSYSSRLVVFTDKEIN